MIRVEDLSFRYAGRDDWVLKDVRLNIQPGECIVLAGPSGCGKSTLAKCLCGLIPHFEKGLRAGHVLVDGADLAEQPMHCIAGRVGAVFQNPRSQFFTTRVMDEVAFGCENAGLPRERMRRRIDDALGRFQIVHLRQRTIFDLSAGERQKAILAAVYAMGTEIWVLDEPSANLDPSTVEGLKAVIGQLKQEGKTLIIAEHRCHYLKGIADRIVLLAGGRIESVHWAEAFFKKSNEEMNRRGLRWIHLPAGIPAPGPTVAHLADPKLAVQNLCFRYPGQRGDALRGAVLAGDGGEIIALTGANGTGKTTLAMLLCGLFKERAGQVRIDGRIRSAKKRLARCRLVLQEADHQLFAENAFRELKLALSGNGDPRTRIMELLDRIGLADKARFRPHALSGGEKQRLAVATALVAEPAILVLDEPTSGLDAGNMGRVGALLKHAAGRGSLVIVITHDEEFIQTCCTRRLRMKKGGEIHERVADDGS